MNVNTQIKQSEINGLFQEVEQMKKDREKLKDQSDSKTEKIISHILKNGNVIAYKDNLPHVLTVKNSISRKFDKSQLAADMEMTTKELDLIGIAELVESGKISSKKLEEYYYDEPTQKLKARKAKKSDIELIFGGARG